MFFKHCDHASIFSLSGNIPDERHWLMMSVIHGLIVFIIIIIVLILIES